MLRIQIPRRKHNEIDPKRQVSGDTVKLEKMWRVWNQKLWNFNFVLDLIGFQRSSYKWWWFVDAIAPTFLIFTQPMQQGSKLIHAQCNSGQASDHTSVFLQSVPPGYASSKLCELIIVKIIKILSGCLNYFVYIFETNMEQRMFL